MKARNAQVQTARFAAMHHDRVRAIEQDQGWSKVPMCLGIADPAAF